MIDDHCYKLVGREPVPCDLLEMADAGTYHVGDTTRYGVRVSTVFLSINHNFLFKGPPLVFETMIFGGPLDGSCWRYSTYDEAERGHHSACKRAHSLVHIALDWARWAFEGNWWKVKHKARKAWGRFKRARSVTNETD